MTRPPSSPAGDRSPVALPATIGAACAEMRRNPALLVVAGGTDTMVPVNEGRLDPSGWLSLRRVDELRRVDRLERGAVRIGAGVTFGRIERELADALPALAQAARTVGSPQIRAAATIGGNVATASPAGDSLPVLLCYDAEVALAAADGERALRLDEFLLGPKRTALRDGELVTAITCREARGSQLFAKVGTRNAMVIALCSLAARLDAVAGDARVAIGAAAPTARLVPAAEPMLLDPTEAAARAFGEAVAAGASPIDDHRGTAAYRRHALRVLATRAHRWLWDDERARLARVSRDA